MTTVEEIHAFLAAAGELTLPVKANVALQSALVSGISQDEAARPGDLSWISPKNLARDPQRPASFKGTILLGPPTLDTTDGQPGAVLLPCTTPKLAFTMVVSRFFPELLTFAWAQPGQVPSDAAIGANVALAPGVVLGNNVELGDSVQIGPNTCLANCTVGANTVIGANCSIGLPGFGYEKDQSGRYRRFPHIGRVLIGENVEIGSNTCIDRAALGATKLGHGVKVDNLVHIAHNVEIGDNAVVIANSMIGGSTRVGPRAWVAPSASILNQVFVGADAVIGMGAVVLRDVGENAVVVGNPAKRLER